MTIKSISLERVDVDGEPDPKGRTDIAFYDENGLIVAAATVLETGDVYAHALEGAKVIAKAAMPAGETFAEEEEV